MIFGIRELLQVHHSQIVQKQGMIRHDRDSLKVVSLSLVEIRTFESLMAIVVVIKAQPGNDGGVHIEHCQGDAG